MIERNDNTEHHVEALELPELAEAALSGRPGSGPSIAVLDEIEIQLEVRLGRSSMKVKDLMALEAGATLLLDQRLDQDVEVLLNGKVVALGALVAVDDHIGLHITQVFTSA